MTRGVVLPRVQSSLVGSAEILSGRRTDDPQRRTHGWQSEAWAFYDDSGPLRYGVTWIANMISKARLHAARLPPGGDEPEPIDEGPAAELVEALAGGIGEQSQLLRLLSTHLMIPGVGYLVGTENGSSWRVYSADVIRLASPATPINSAVYEIQVDREKWQQLDDESLVVKIWRPHARFPWEPDSPARAALPALRELRRIGQYIEATLVSRLAGAGLFIFPKEATFPTAPGEGSKQHPFVTEVMDVMMTAVRKPGTAAQIVPIPVEVPGEYADKFKLVPWASELSEKVLEMRESALRQTSIALDIPAEVLTGMGDLTHWNAWQIEESAVKVHAEPLLEVITSALTEGYLHPALAAAGEDTSEVLIWADTSELAARPDRSDDAIALYDRGELNGEALRRETGMGDGDALEGDELADWVWKRLLSQTPLAPTALVGLGIEIPEAPTIGEPEEEEEPEEPPVEEDSEGGPPSTRDDDEAEPSTGPPTEMDLARLLVLEGHVRRALQVAKNRLNGGNRKHEPFDGLWADARETLSEIGLDPACTIDRLESYCHTLLKNGMEYDRRSLALALKDTCVVLESVA